MVAPTLNDPAAEGGCERPDSDSGSGSGPTSGSSAHDDPESDSGDESFVEVVGALIEDAGLYAQAEIGFQKTRAALAARSLGVALGALVLGLILLHLALIALAVGFVIALAPLVTIWGAIAIVVGGMLAGVAVLGGIALTRARRIAAMFADDPGDTRTAANAQTAGAGNEAEAA